MSIECPTLTKKAAGFHPAALNLYGNFLVFNANLGLPLKYGSACCRPFLRNKWRTILLELGFWIVFNFK